jgi:hypothetical protein
MVTKFSPETITLLRQHLFAGLPDQDDKIAALPATLDKCGLSLIPVAHDPRSRKDEQKELFTIELNIQQVLSIMAAAQVYVTCVAAIASKQMPRINGEALDSNLAETVRDLGIVLAEDAGLMKKTSDGKIITLVDPR